MNTIQKLLLENKAWANEKNEADAFYFSRLSQLQTPEFFWIGCCDSRVPANEITGTQPGEVFVHRNIANMVVHNDVNMLSALEYAVNHLKVKHVIVCGHYGCGGVKAAVGNVDYKPILNMWVRGVKDVYTTNKTELENIGDSEQRLNRLTELNVVEQVKHLAKTSIIQQAWKKDQSLTLHGWIFGLENGILKELSTVDSTTAIDPIYHFKDL